MGVSSKTIEKIKQSSISELIEATGCSLKKAGREYVTKCIWHDDTNPSLTINDDKSFCFCHACGNGGDHFEFVQKRYGVNFRDAAERAASLLSIDFVVDNEDPQAARKIAAEKKRIISKLTEEQEFYYSILKDPITVRPRELLKNRGINESAIDEFRIGYATKGFFEDRITLPITNHKDELVGFTARATRSGQQPKYKNSKTSELFNKTSIVFNESRAKFHSRQSNSIIFVEGNFDVVSMWQVGITNAVAIQGTGTPTRDTLLRITKNISNIVLCFDGDQGGKVATERFLNVAHKLALEGNFNIYVASLPDGQDPDDVIREYGGDALYSYIANAVPWLDWTIDSIGQSIDRDNHKQVADYESYLREYIDKIPSSSVRKSYIKKAALLLASDYKQAETIAEEWSNKKVNFSIGEWHMPDVLNQRIGAEARLLRLYVHLPELRDRLEPLISLVQHPPFQWLGSTMKELQDTLGSQFVIDDVVWKVIFAESYYAPQVRKILDPSVQVVGTEKVICHIERVLNENIQAFPRLKED